MNVWVVDIDSTVSNSWHRLKAICDKYSVSDADFLTEEHLKEWMSPELIKNDELIEGAAMLPELARRCGAKMVFLTGRSECIRRETRIWLEHRLNIFDSVPLVMRKEGDMRLGSEVKEELFVNSIIPMYSEANFTFFDDDEKLLPIYSKYGLALKAPECWSIIRFEKEEADE